jgi:hypothetical protein
MLILSLLALAFVAWLGFEALMLYGARIGSRLGALVLVVVLLAAPFVAFELAPPVKCWAFCGP